MAIMVRIPTPLQRMTGNQAEVATEGSTVDELIAALDKQYPGLKGRLCD